MANYAQARRIFEHLSNKGFRIDPSREWKFEPMTFDERLIEELAEAEHERWCNERKEQGWREGRRTNPSKLWDRICPWRWKRHDCLVPWDQLASAEQMTDRKMVKKWPTILKEVGFQIRPGNSS